MCCIFSLLQLFWEIKSSHLLTYLAMLMQALLRMLPAYYNHFRAFENALVTKFYGLHCVKLTGPAQKKVKKLVGL